MMSNYPYSILKTATAVEMRLMSETSAIPTMSASLRRRGHRIIIRARQAGQTLSFHT